MPTRRDILFSVFAAGVITRTGTGLAKTVLRDALIFETQPVETDANEATNDDDVQLNGSVYA